MKPRTIQTIGRPIAQPGSGILRPFPSPELPHIDPFVFLDTGAPRQLGSHTIYVGPHPHRGVHPVSLLFRGHIEHRDSLGNHTTVESGGIQWLASGSGALHEEVLGADSDGVFHMAQLWINVPDAHKMAPPEHHGVPADQVPVLTHLGAGVRMHLYAGTFGGAKGPGPLTSPTLVAHVQLQPGAELAVPVSSGWTAAFTVVAGSVEAGDSGRLGPGATAVFAPDGEGFIARSIAGGEVLVLCGEPIGEPIVAGGGFVMTRAEDLETAFEDYRAGRMGQLTASR